jgi:hypothetical protein
MSMLLAGCCMMFDNYDIQVALLNAKDALSLFERDKSNSALSHAIQKFNDLLLINESRIHLQRYELALCTICELARLYQYQYDTYENEEDLAHGVSFYETAESLMGEFHPDRSSILINLGNLLLERFKLERNSLFIERAIGYFQEADEFYQKMIAFESIDQSKRSKILNDLGLGLSERFAAIGNRSDLYGAIDIFKKATKLTQENRNMLNSR